MNIRTALFMTNPARRGAAPGWFRWALLAVGLAAMIVLPWSVFPPVALNVVCWALFAMALDLLLGYTGLLSFGHAAFFGGAAYAGGLVSVHWAVPFPVAVLAGAAFAGLLAVPIGYLSVRRTGIYFAMVTLAFAQLVYFTVNQWRSLTGGENGLQGVPRTFLGADLSDPLVFYYAAIPMLLLGMLAAWRIVHSPFGRVLVAIRDNPARAQALGYNVARYKLVVFVLSATLSGVAGATFALGNSFATLDDVNWTTSGQVVVILVLGGMATLWGSVLGAALIVLLNNALGLAGFSGTDIVTGAIFVVVVLLFRRGIWGTAAHGIGLWRRRAIADGATIPDDAAVADGAAAPDNAVVADGAAALATDSVDRADAGEV